MRNWPSTTLDGYRLSQAPGSARNHGRKVEGGDTDARHQKGRVWAKAATTEKLGSELKWCLARSAGSRMLGIWTFKSFGVNKGLRLKLDSRIYGVPRSHNIRTLLCRWLRNGLQTICIVRYGLCEIAIYKKNFNRAAYWGGYAVGLPFWYHLVFAFFLV